MSNSTRLSYRIYAYVDSNIPMLMRMYEKTLKGYKTIGYSVSEDERSRGVLDIKTDAKERDEL